MVRLAAQASTAHVSVPTDDSYAGGSCNASHSLLDDAVPREEVSARATAHRNAAVMIQSD